MTLIKDIVSNVELTEYDRRYFVGMCADWVRFCESISHMDRQRIIKLLKYLTEDRPYSNRLLVRAISRFNRLNALKKEDLR